MDTLLLEAMVREQGTPKALRQSGKIPAVCYGRGQTPFTLMIPYQQFRKVYEKAGENTIIELSVGGKKTPVLVHDMQYDPLTDKISHVDFLHVDMKKEVTTTVKVVVLGIAPAVKNLGGVLDIQKHEIKIKCLPKDLIHQIEVDISPIVDFHTSIHVKDLVVPATIKILDRMEDTVATVTPPRAEEPTPSEAAAAVPVEGAAAAAGTPTEGAAAGATPAVEAKK